MFVEENIWSHFKTPLNLFINQPIIQFPSTNKLCWFLFLPFSCLHIIVFINHWSYNEQNEEPLTNINKVIQGSTNGYILSYTVVYTSKKFGVRMGTANLFWKGFPQTKLFLQYLLRISFRYHLSLPRHICQIFVHTLKIYGGTSWQDATGPYNNLKNLVMIFISLLEGPLVSSIYTLKVNNKNIRTRCKTVQN